MGINNISHDGWCLSLCAVPVIMCSNCQRVVSVPLYIVLAVYGNNYAGDYGNDYAIDYDDDYAGDYNSGVSGNRLYDPV